MKRQQHNFLIVLALIIGTALYAQKSDKKYTEEFKTNSDVIINVDTRHTDIEIETWNKNTVSIEATIEIEGASPEKMNAIIKNWKFKALGNKNEIEIISKTHSLFAGNSVVSIHDDLLRIADNDFDFVIPEVSVGNLAILDSLHVVMPDALHFPDLPIAPEFETFSFEFETPEFDYEKYKNDKDYMKKWQDEMKKNLEKMNIELKENTIILKENSAKRKEELKAAQKARKEALIEHAQKRKKALKKSQEMRTKALEKRTKERREETKIRREVYEKRRKELAKRRADIKVILADRETVKIKRIIKIKAPKDAKFNMNVRYGSMSFPN